MRKHIIRFYSLLLIWFSVPQVYGYANSIPEQTPKKGTSSLATVMRYDSISRSLIDQHPDSSLFYSELAYRVASRSKDNVALSHALLSLGTTFYHLNKLEKSIEFYYKGAELFEQAGDTANLAFTLHNIGLTHYKQKRYNEAIQTLQRGAKLYNQINDFDNEATIHTNTARCFLKKNDRISALDYAIKGANLFLRIGNQHGLANAYNLIGTIQLDITNRDLAYEYFIKTYNLYKEIGDSAGLASITNNLGVVLDELDRNDEALRYFLEYLDYSIQTNYTKGQYIAYNNIGYLYFKTQRNHEALNAYSKSLAISTALGDSTPIVNTHNNIASVFLGMGELDKAIQYVNTGLKYMPNEVNIDYLSESHEILSKVYAAKHDYIKAYQHQSVTMAIKDSLFSIKTNEQIMEMQIRFEMEQKEKEIELLKKNDEIKNLNLQKQKNVNFIWFVIMLLLGIVAILIYVSLQQKKKSNTLLHEKNSELVNSYKKLLDSEEHLKELNATKDRLFTIIAHDLKNPMNVLLGYSELLYTHFEKYDEQKKLELNAVIYHTSQNLSMLMENMLQWARAQTGVIKYNPEHFPLSTIVKQEVNLHSSLLEQKQLKVVNRVEDSIIVFADINLVSIIVRNLLNNAIKFSNLLDRIIINASEKDGMVEVKVTDYGIGMSKTEIGKLFKIDSSYSSLGTSGERGTGLGLIICKDFVEKNGGEIYVTSQEGLGSSFIFTLPANKSGINV